MGRHTSSSWEGRGPYCTDVRYTLRRCSRMFHNGGADCGAGQSIARSLALTTPRSAASVTALVQLRSDRFSSALSGPNQDFAVALKKSGRCR